MKLYDKKLHNVARRVYAIAFEGKPEVMKNLDSLIVVNFWDSVLDFFVSPAGKLMLWYRNVNTEFEFLFSITENRFYKKFEYSKILNDKPLSNFVHFIYK